MNLYEKIKNMEEKISIIGLGYVGIPLAIRFARKAKVIGFDIDVKKIEKYKKGIDVTMEVGDQAIKETKVYFTTDEKEIGKAKFHIITVPTPIDCNKNPDLSYLIDASKIVGRNLSKGSIVVYESTVYPGVTEEICIPILEESGLKCGIDFKVGYSPERINPGDRDHGLETITKIVSGIDEESLDIITKVYQLVIKGIYRAESIKVAEAAKVIENAQRDINIAFMNELSIIFNKLGIDMKLVLEAASTKWNFLNFIPGLVGGHCIGVDPYYLTYKAKQIGYHSQVILAGRKINDDMSKYIAENTVKNLIKAGKGIKGSKVAIMGIAFKENCPDIRNTKVLDIIYELREYDIDPQVVDPVVDPEEVYKKYGIRIYNIKDIKDVDGIIFAVSHEAFTSLSLRDIEKMYSGKKPVLIDVKRLFNRKEAIAMGYVYWGV